jgi:hypothetical protein
MAIKCKLISPTNLLLEHPMFSPVNESEFVVMGTGEWSKQKRELFFHGLMAGALLAGAICVLAVILGVAWRDRHMPRQSQYPVPAHREAVGSRISPVSYVSLSKTEKVRQIASLALSFEG